MMNNKRALVAAIFLAWMPVFIGVAYPAMWNWSITASSNASADPTINFREGQPPSSINDSARALMAVVAGYRDDISGSLTTTGTASAYLVSTNQILPNPPTDGQMLAITVNITNGISPTLSADGGGAFPIQSSAGVAIPAGTLILGSPYSLKFSLSNNAWILRDFFASPLIIPLGAMMPYTGTSVPNSNFVFPAGQCLSTTTYATYWTFLGSPSSGSCGGGQFQIVDISGRVPAGLDTMPGFSAANRLTSSSTGCGTAMTSVGAVCANGLEGFATTLAQLPTGISSSTGASPFTVSPGTLVSTPIGGITTFSANAGAQVWQAWSTGATINIVNPTASGSVTSTNTSGNAHPNIQPTIGLTYLLRVI
jgi:hypothetical protein